MNRLHNLTSTHRTRTSIFKCTLFSTIVTLLIASSILGQDIRTERIQFERGTSGATIEGSITGSQIIDYKLNARSGQVMNVSMGTDNSANYFNIMEPKEQYVAIFNGSMGENMYEGTLAKSGDYTIRVYLYRNAARRNEKANFRLEVNIAASHSSESNAGSHSGSIKFDSTGKIPCSIGSGQPTGNCDFGVTRRGNGDADVEVTWKDGSKHYIYFQNGKAVGYDKGQGDRGEFRSSKESDLFIIRIGNERYEIPEALVFGG